MTRRRLILAIVAAALCGMAWWLSLDRLSAVERLLVGTWTFNGKSDTSHSEMCFGADRRYGFGWVRTSHATMVECCGPWFIRRGEIVLENEPKSVWRALRPVLSSVGLSSKGAITHRLESITLNEMVVVSRRAPGKPGPTPRRTDRLAGHTSPNFRSVNPSPAF